MVSTNKPQKGNVMVFRPSTESNGYVVIRGERYHRHRGNGGWVAETAAVEDSVFVDVTSHVHSGATLTGRVRVEEGSNVGRNARLGGSVVLRRTDVPEDTVLQGDFLVFKGKLLSRTV